ncbi:PTS transporter subunit EIIC [Zooshikella marina]|uniref:PTS transporter subunit EIIC n=1 Tax=Zooshikella ganghwensis TaxID=202772 RepID=UPI001BAF7AAD|nr:PTS transporter subunit EIIC [Zooshikella ganghwensis]MBU2708684.1 PTS transporter subunit EIIC [Zooshikella ganghwensis]
MNLQAAKSFEFFQRVGRAMMTVVLILPLVSILMGIGGIILNPNVHAFIPFLDAPSWLSVGLFLQKAGQALFNNLPLLFAVGIASTWTGKPIAGFSSLIAFLVMHTVIGVLIQTNGGTAALAEAWATDIGQPVDALQRMFGQELGIQTLQTGVFGGMLIGFTSAWVYNRFHQVKLPDAIALFAGERSVPIMASFFAIFLGLLLFWFWPYAHIAILSIGDLIASNTNALVVGMYGAVEKMLIPFGLHHIYNAPILFSPLGGEYLTIDGQTIVGDQNIYIASVVDRLQNSDISVVGGHFIAGKFIPVMFGLPGAALAMYHTAKTAKRKIAGSLLLAAAFTAFLTGITEPLEFTFLFVAPLLYVAHTLLTGIAFGLAAMLDLQAGFGGGSGVIDYILFNVLPHHNNAWITIAILGVIFFAVYYVTFRFLILKFNLPTPGRTEDQVKLYSSQEYRAKQKEQQQTGQTSSLQNSDSQAAQVIAAFGGQENLAHVDACLTRLRVSVNNHDLIDKPRLIELGAKDVLVIGKGIQAIFGTNSSILKEEILELMA